MWFLFFKNQKLITLLRTFFNSLKLHLLKIHSKKLLWNKIQTPIFLEVQNYSEFKFKFNIGCPIKIWKNVNDIFFVVNSKTNIFWIFNFTSLTQIYSYSLDTLNSLWKKFKKFFQKFKTVSKFKTFLKTQKRFKKFKNVKTIYKRNQENFLLFFGCFLPKFLLFPTPNKFSDKFFTRIPFWYFFNTKTQEIFLKDQKSTHKFKLWQQKFKSTPNFFNFQVELTEKIISCSKFLSCFKKFGKVSTGRKFGV